MQPGWISFTSSIFTDYQKIKPKAKARRRLIFKLRTKGLWGIGDTRLHHDGHHPHETDKGGKIESN